MDRDEAREIKLQLADFARDLAERAGTDATASAAGAPGEESVAVRAARAAGTPSR